MTSKLFKSKPRFHLLKTIEWNADLTDEVFVVEVFIQDFELDHGHVRNGDVKLHIVVPLECNKE